MKHREAPVLISGFAVPDKVLMFGLVTVTLFIFYLSSATDVLFWLLIATLTFIFGHAFLMTPPVIDEFGFGTPGQPDPPFVNVPLSV